MNFERKFSVIIENTDHFRKWYAMGKEHRIKSGISITHRNKEDTEYYAFADRCVEDLPFVKEIKPTKYITGKFVYLTEKTLIDSRIYNNWVASVYSKYGLIHVGDSKFLVTDEEKLTVILLEFTHLIEKVQDEEYFYE